MSSLKELDTSGDIAAPFPALAAVTAQVDAVAPQGIEDMVGARRDGQRIA